MLHGEGEIVEKKSRFIANVRPVSSEEEAVAFINEMKKKADTYDHLITALDELEENILEYIIGVF